MTPVAGSGDGFATRELIDAHFSEMTRSLAVAIPENRDAVYFECTAWFQTIDIARDDWTYINARLARIRADHAVAG